MSLDFRIGVEGYFDPAWMMRGTKADHNRREVLLLGGKQQQQEENSNRMI